jgi:hypothetical protein
VVGDEVELLAGVCGRHARLCSPGSAVARTKKMGLGQGRGRADLCSRRGCRSLAPTPTTTG